MVEVPRAFWDDLNEDLKDPVLAEVYYRADQAYDCGCCMCCGCTCDEDLTDA